MTLRGALPLDATVVASRPGWCVATWRNVMVLHVGGELDPSFLDAALAGHHAALAVEPHGYGVVSVAEPSAKLPPSEVRSRATELRKQTQHMLRAQSMVIRGEGFFASAMRGAVTGIYALAQSRVPSVISASDVDAAEFVVRRACAPDVDPGHLVQVLSALRRSGVERAAQGSSAR